MGTAYYFAADIPATPGHGAQTQYIAPGSLYALHPTTEEIATAMAADYRPQPVSRYDLARALPAALVSDDEDEDEDEEI